MISRKHEKKTLSLYDDKRYIIEDYRSLAYGHKDAKELISMNDVRKTYQSTKLKKKQTKSKSRKDVSVTSLASLAPASPEIKEEA